MSENTTARRPRWFKWLITLGVIAIAGVIIWSQLPRMPYPTDLSLIGQGRPALVMVYDHFYVAGGEVMHLMDPIRRDYADRVEFLVADMSAPAGRAFAERHGVRDGTVLLFDARGGLVESVIQPQSAAELRRALDQIPGI